MTTMQQMEELYQVLENLINLHKALFTLAAEKKEVLIKGDSDALLRITKQETKLIQAVEAAESARGDVMNRIAAAKGLSFSDQTLLGLIKAITSAEEKLRLKAYREELIRIVSQLREANELNQQLLAQSLSFINASLDLLTDTPEEDFIYKRPKGYGSGVQANRPIINKKM